jgi:carbonic anhydrase
MMNHVSIKREMVNGSYMSNELIGKIVQHKGKIYQISSGLLIASSYGADNGIEETIFVSRNKGNVVAKKSLYRKKQKTSCATRTRVD